MAGLELEAVSWQAGMIRIRIKMESRDSRLIEVADDTKVAINGNKFRIGDLILDFS